MSDEPTRTIAIVLYEGFTALDAVGPYDTLGHLPGSRTVFVAERPGPVAGDRGTLSLVAACSFDDLPRPELIVVPGGPDALVEKAAPAVVPWLREADRHSELTTSVCTGALLLAHAGLLTGRRATTHWLSRERLAALGARPVPDRVVTDGKYVTAAGVSSGIDMGLTLLGRLAGDRVAQSAQLMIEYDPQPPYDAGSPESAPADLVAHWRKVAGSAASGA
ncbi:DJ-1/PfpI family protein [Streptomyces durbertensis]|uniref:DJ-1/PfpI family protein n=1 Tax=Streptomyces durbertensis TaxID=2448886 RepID=A0ABR6ELJ1_9ACTN|nr:DJ-1/PfpI family protein [Streptomyces durbertensis]MBB1246191.1 DJ-1/PfpI family protein [Streptomyces durbertensis]